MCCRTTFFRSRRMSHSPRESSVRWEAAAARAAAANSAACRASHRTFRTWGTSKIQTSGIGRTGWSFFNIARVVGQTRFGLTMPAPSFKDRESASGNVTADWFFDSTCPRLRQPRERTTAVQPQSLSQRLCKLVVVAPLDASFNVNSAVVEPMPIPVLLLRMYWTFRVRVLTQSAPAHGHLAHENSLMCHASHRVGVATPPDESPQGLLHQLVGPHRQPSLKVPRLLGRHRLDLVGLPGRLEYV